MNELENIFRWAFYYDFGKSLEQFFGIRPTRETVLGLETSCSDSNIQNSLFRLTAREMLNIFRTHVIRAGKKHNIDARAIAGAIAWEYEENLKGRISDKFQVHLGGGRGIGWGSIHHKPAKDIRPNLSEQELVCARLDAEQTISMVAEIMAQNAQRYFELTNGIWINDNPVLLAYFFNTGMTETVVKKAKSRRLNVSDENLVVPLTVTVNPMAKWIYSNIGRFEDFKTVPDEPKTWFARAKAE